jgi:hypothetical protein
MDQQHVDVARLVSIPASGRAEHTGMFAVSYSLTHGRINDFASVRLEDSGTSEVAAVHASMRSVGGTIAGSVQPPGPGWNYYRVRVEDGEGRAVRILLNAAIGVVAASFDEGVPASGPLDFQEVPGADAYRQVGLTVAEPDALRAPLRAEHCEDRPESQRAEVKYHRAESFGDVVFNWFE